MILRKLLAVTLALLLVILALPLPVAATGTANDDTRTVNEDDPATAFDVLANDSGATAVTAVGVASHGTATLDAGVVTYKPDLDYNGTDSFTYTVDGGPDIATVSVTVLPVNDPPSFSVGADVQVHEDAGPQTVSGWATGISAGPADEAGQVLGFQAVAETPGLFSAGPTLDPATGDLTFTPAANANGSSSVEVTLADNGGTANGGSDTSAVQTFTITVSPVNDAPSFTAGTDQTVLEDAGPQTVSGWATGISAGPADEAGQALTFQLTAGSASLFSVQPAVDPATGTLSYTPAANANGSTLVGVSLKDDGGTDNGGSDTSAVQAFTITITPQNDPPTAVDDTLVVNEEAPATAVDVLLNDSAAPDTGEVLTVVSIGTASHGTASLTGGIVRYAPAQDYFGQDSFGYTVSDGQGGTASATVTVTVDPVNDAPSFTKGADQQVDEDAGAQTVFGWATGISAGPANESAQTLAFQVSTSSDPLFATLPAVSASGTLTFTPAANANGSATVTVTLHDDGGTANGGVDVSASQQFTITVRPVNDAPSFTKGANQAVLEDAGPQSVSGWATSISRGPVDESSQALTFHVTATTTSLFAVQPAISAAGTLTYTPAASANGSTTVGVYLTDDGGTANGGSDTSPVQTFTITINAVNDAPSFLKGSNQAVNEDAGPRTVSGWATGMSAGPANEAGQALAFTVTANSNASLFAAGPTVDAATGDLAFTPAPNANGVATITLRLSDNGGTANGGVDSVSQTFAITVVAVNDAPSFTAPAVVTATRNDGTRSSYAIPGWATSISAGPADESAQALQFQVTANSNPGLFIEAPAVGPDGTLTFLPTVNTSGSADITVVLHDNGGTAAGGVDTSTAHTLTITVSGANQPPIASTDLVAVRMTGPTSLDVLANDSAGPGEPDDHIVVTGAYGATRGYLSIAPDGKSVTYDPIGCSTGTDAFRYVITDDGGLSYTGKVSVTIRSPASYPAADGPGPRLVTGSTIGSSASVRLRWCGRTSGTTVKKYTLARRINGGGWTTLASYASSTSSTRSVSFGSKLYQFRARILDKRNHAAYGYGPVFSVTRLQETSSAITYTGSWRTKRDTRASGNALRYASSSSASASIVVTGVRQVGIVAPKGSGLGSFRVYVNGTKVSTVSERASSASNRKILYVRSLDPGRTYTIKLKPSGNGRIYLDAILTLK